MIYLIIMESRFECIKIRPKNLKNSPTPVEYFRECILGTIKNENHKLQRTKQRLPCVPWTCSLPALHVEILTDTEVIAFPLGIICCFGGIEIENVLPHHIPEEDFVIRVNIIFGQFIPMEEQAQ